MRFDGSTVTLMLRWSAAKELVAETFELTSTYLKNGMLAEEWTPSSHSWCLRSRTSFLRVLPIEVTVDYGQIPRPRGLLTILGTTKRLKFQIERGIETKFLQRRTVTS